MSKENARDKLLVLKPTLMAIIFESERPWPVLQRTDVSDSHVDRSHPVCDSRTADVYVAGPMLPPCSVTLAEPVAARFVRDDTLNIPT